jgi:hypothetical protein
MRRPRELACLLALAFLFGCFGRSYQPQPLESVPFGSRAQTQERAGVVITAAVPTPEEAEAIFGIPVYERRVQPVWLEVTNNTSTRMRFAPVGTDRNYFSPMEIWYTNQGKLNRKGGEALQRRLLDLTMPRQIPKGTTRSGFVFTHASPGTKSFTVDLFGVGASDYNFVFFIDVPGLVPDHAQVDIESLYRPEEIREVGMAGLRDALQGLPCCAVLPVGSATGLPANVVFVGPGKDVLTALLRAGWYEIARPTTEFEKLRSPRLFDRVPDAVFRLARGEAGDRNELRVWMAPLRVGGDPVWVSQMTHYIQRPTKLGTALLDSSLDPDVDEARNYMLQRMWYSQALARFAFVSGEKLDTAADLSAFFSGSRYFSDGDRLVLWLSAAPISLLEARNLRWDAPQARDNEALAR